VIRAIEDRMRRMRVSAPSIEASGMVVGIPVAEIRRENGETWIVNTWLFVGLVRVHQGSLLRARKPATSPAMKIGRSIL